MLELKNIKKTYKVGDIETKALDGVSVSFREKEFVAILGPSGSGKTTSLNIIGGLDRYDSGEMSIKGKKTTDFKDRDWDAYRNNSIGFVFQNYNLISHIGIVANVELGMTLSGVSASEKRKRAIEALTRVGLEKHLNKKPNQLSGGQMQRVAIARALANDPEILLCDEPTGALDSVTSVQIMDLIKELSTDRLVVMVTHNPDIAERYADRIIKFSDGTIIEDTHPHNERPKPDEFRLKKTSMSFFTALRLSFTNLLTKKGRTFLTAFASSIGIIGIAVILSLSAGFKIQVDNFQRDALSEFPIFMSPSAVEVDAEQMRGERTDKHGVNAEGAAADVVFLYDPQANIQVHVNVFSDDYLDYLKNIDPTAASSIGYVNITSLNVLVKSGGEVKPASFSTFAGMGNNAGGMAGMSGMISGTSGLGLPAYPVMLDENAPSYIEKNYELLSGTYPTAATDLALLVDADNRMDYRIFEALGYDAQAGDEVNFADIVGREFVVVPNDNYYEQTDFGNFMPRTDYGEMYTLGGNIKTTVTGVIRLKEGKEIGLLGNGIAYSNALTDIVLNVNGGSEIVKAQRGNGSNVMTMQELGSDEAKTRIIQYLGGDPTPLMIMVYPVDFNAKEQVTQYLDDYNDSRAGDDKVTYTDLAATISGMTGNIMDAITVVLIAFAAISLVVSLIMICIITYTSVLERTKEIGVLKALGARKKDITRVFDAETCILGVFSGVLGVVVAYLLTIPANMIIYKLTDLPDVAQLPFMYAVLLVIISTALTMLGGHIPARMASKKDAVEALRSE